MVFGGLFVIDELVEKLSAGTIGAYRYDPTTAALKQCNQTTPLLRLENQRSDIERMPLPEIVEARLGKRLMLRVEG